MYVLTVSEEKSSFFVRLISSIFEPFLPSMRNSKKGKKLNFETFPMSLRQLKQIYHSNEMRFPEEICLRGKFRRILRYYYIFKIFQYYLQFHQHFTRNFFAAILAPKNCKAKPNYRKAAQFAFVRKSCT